MLQYLIPIIVWASVKFLSVYFLIKMEYLGSMEKPLVLLGCAFLSWKIVRHIWSFLNIEKDPITVLVTGAAGMLINYMAAIIFYTVNILFTLFGFWMFWLWSPLLQLVYTNQEIGLLIVHAIRSSKSGFCWSVNKDIVISSLAHVILLNNSWIVKRRVFLTFDYHNNNYASIPNKFHLAIWIALFTSVHHIPIAIWCQNILILNNSQPL